jgi:hypothetical protein
MSYSEEIKQIERVKEILSERLEKAGGKPVVFYFTGMANDLLLSNQMVFEEILNTIQDKSNREVSWRYKIEQRRLPISADRPNPEFLPPVPVGVEILVKHPDQLEKTFLSILNLSNAVVQQVSVVEGGSETVTRYSKSRLLIEKDESGIPAGFLQLSKHSPKLRIAEADSRKFKLVVCLFNPTGSMAEPYHPVAQNYSRVFDHIRKPNDKANGNLDNFSTQRSAMITVIKNTIKEIRRDEELKKYFNFIWNNDLVRLEINLQGGQ